MAKITESVQPRLDLIPHDYRGEVIGQRTHDGYINATAMCQAAEEINESALVREEPAAPATQGMNVSDNPRQGGACA